jgi:hypothetical protein
MALHPHVKWNDGEGLTHTDLQYQSSYLFRQALEAMSYLSGRDMGAAMTARYSATQGGDFFVEGSSDRQNLTSGKAYVPFPMAGLITLNTAAYSGVSTSTLTLGPGVVVMAQTTSTTGTAPSGVTTSTPMLYCFSASSYDITAAYLSTAYSVAAHPDNRTDTLCMRLDFASGDTESRDIEDAVTRALTTQSVDKEYYVSATCLYVPGTVYGATSWASAAPAVTAGYAPIISLQRSPGDTTPRNGTTNGTYYHVYPMRYASETVFPQDFFLDDEYYYTGTNALNRGQNFTEWWVSKTGTLSGTHYAYAMPRNMHAGCRLIGISYGFTATSPLTAVLGVASWSSSGATAFNESLPIDTAGNGSFGVLNARFTSTSSYGWMTITERDWQGNAAYPLPVWGNGTTYGPLFSANRFNQGTDVAAPYAHGSQGWLGVRFSCTNTDYQVGPVTFHYLY